MRWFRFAILILAITILQAELIKVFGVTELNIRPDLLLVLVVFFSIYCKTNEAIITSFTIGFAADLIGLTMGPLIISFGLAGTLLTYLTHVITIRKMPYQAITIFIMSILTGLLSIMLRSLKGMEAVPNMYSILLWSSLYSSLVGPFLFLPVAWWMQVKPHRFKRS